MSVKTFLHGALLGLTWVMLANIGPAQATDGGVWVPGLTQAKSGTIVCGGFYRVNQAHRARWVLRNDNEEGDINLEKIRLYDAEANLLDEWLGDDVDFPADANGIVGSGDNTIAAHQTVRYRSEDSPWAQIFLGPGNVQVVFDWSAEKRVIPPTISLVRYVNEPYGGPVLARSAAPCNRIR